MYKVKIVTKYNVINMEVEDTNTPEIQEIFQQPYVLEVYIDKIREICNTDKNMLTLNKKRR